MTNLGEPEVSVLVPLGPGENWQRVQWTLAGVPAWCEVIVEPGDRGISAALNRATQRARGKYVCRLDVGDRWWPGRANRMLNAVEQHQWLAACHDYTGRPHPRPELHRLSMDNQLCGSTTIVLRELALELPYDEELRWCVDWDWHAAVQYLGGGWQYVPLELAECYERPGGHTDRGRTNPRRNQDRAKVHRRWRRAPTRVEPHFRTI